MTDKPPTTTRGNGPARALVGLMGAVAVLAGIALTYFTMMKWPFGFLGAIPGLLIVAYGGNLLLACLRPDDFEVEPGLLGFPTVVRRKQ
jgi:hypothetical protein